MFDCAKLKEKKFKNGAGPARFKSWSICFSHWLDAGKHKLAVFTKADHLVYPRCLRIWPARYLGHYSWSSVGVWRHWQADDLSGPRVCFNVYVWFQSRHVRVAALTSPPSPSKGCQLSQVAQRQTEECLGLADLSEPWMQRVSCGDIGVAAPSTLQGKNSTCSTYLRHLAKNNGFIYVFLLQ